VGKKKGKAVVLDGKRKRKGFFAPEKRKQMNEK